MQNGKEKFVKIFNILTAKFEDVDDYMHDIHRGIMNCNTDIADDSLYCSSVSKRCVGSIIIDFHYWFNNCKSAFQNVFSFVKHKTKPRTLSIAL